MFLSSYEKQLDSKRRIVVPQEIRALISTPFGGVYCLHSIEADCLEAGGQEMHEMHRAAIAETAFGDPLRHILHTALIGGAFRLPFDVAGRIVLPERLCELAGLSDWVSIVGMGESFQIWDRDRYREWSETARPLARDGLAELRRRQQDARLAAKT